MTKLPKRWMDGHPSRQTTTASPLGRVTLFELLPPIIDWEGGQHHFLCSSSHFRPTRKRHLYTTATHGFSQAYETPRPSFSDLYHSIPRQMRFITKIASHFPSYTLSVPCGTVFFCARTQRARLAPVAFCTPLSKP
jgi:hypothetical protein